MNEQPVEPARRSRWNFRRFQERPLLRPTRPGRAFVFLAINLAGYVFANAFLHYLATGRWVGGVGSYAEAFSRPFGYTLVRPLSVLTHPWLILVFGLLLAAVIIVPLLVACLYHSRYCVFFLPCVVFLAQAPVLTLCLAVGCVLVAATPLRHKAPMLALLLGLLPVGVYLYFASSPGPTLTSPIQRLILYVPFVTAAVGAVIAGGLVLLIARLTRYLPGVIWPVMAVLLVAPSWLFYRYIGADELEYAVLAEQLTPAGSLFADQALSVWRHEHNFQGSPAELLEAVRADLAARKAGILARCNRFIREHPDSDRLSAVWWIQGITLDTQISVRRLSAELVQSYDDVPAWDPQAAQRSAEHWRALAERFADDVRAGDAWWRLALLELRVDEKALAELPEDAQAQVVLEKAARARQMLDLAEQALTPLSESSANPNAVAEVFRRDPGVPSGEHLRRIEAKVRQMQWLMRVNNAAQDARNARAFIEYVGLDLDRQTLGASLMRIRGLAEQYADTDLADNFALADATSLIEGADRARALLAITQEYDPASDGAIRARYELGLLVLQGQAADGLKSAAEYFRAVAREAPGNPWCKSAEEHYQRLAVMEGTP